MSSEPIEPEIEAAFARLGQEKDIPWKHLPEAHFDGVYNKVLYMNRVTGETFEYVKIEEGAEMPRHYHPTMQATFQTEGELRRPNGEVARPGKFEMVQAGEEHGGYVADETAKQFKYFAGRPIFFMPDGASYVYQEDGQMLDIGDHDIGRQLTEENILIDE